MDALTETDLRELRRLVADYFSARGREVVIDPWQARSEGRIFGLINVFQEAACIERGEWPDYIARRFDVFDRVDTELPDTYELVAPRLRVRLAVDEAVRHYDPSVRRRICDGLSEILMVRFDSGSFTMPPEAWSRWEISCDLVWKDAVEHTVWDEPRERRLAISPSGVRLGWIGGGWFASSMLLDLARFLPPSLEHGAMVMVPCNDALLFAHLDERAPEAFAALLEFGGRWYADGPHAISPDVFWWRPGKIERLTAHDGKRWQPCWGAEFSKALADLDPTSGSGAELWGPGPKTPRQKGRGRIKHPR
jgi:hypothetical protein